MLAGSNVGPTQFDERTMRRKGGQAVQRSWQEGNDSGGEKKGEEKSQK